VPEKQARAPGKFIPARNPGKRLQSPRFAAISCTDSIDAGQTVRVFSISRRITAISQLLYPETQDLKRHFSQEDTALHDGGKGV
jgi:hypothetical protein